LLLTPLRADSATTFQVNPNAGPGDVIVRGRDGGLIFGFEIDPNGNEGLLAEAVLNSDGTVSAKVETFSQSTGRILRIVERSETQDDFIGWGVAGSIGLFEREHVQGFNVQRSFRLINPLDNHKVTGAWTPPIDADRIVNEFKPALDGSANAAIYALSVNGSKPPLVFTSDLATNTFSSAIGITDPDFTTEAPPVIAFD
jgi:hypothetical protein